MILYDVYHRREIPEFDFKAEWHIGIYSSKGKAREGIEQLKLMPGFSRYPDGFVILKRELDRGGENGECFVYQGSDVSEMSDLGRPCDPDLETDGAETTQIYYLRHTYSYPKPDPYGDDEKIVGLYSTKLNAKLASRRLIGKPGFSKYSKAFVILTGGLNHTGCETGFVTAGEMLEDD